MRSFIKSHRKANSLDESPSSTRMSPVRHGETTSTQRPLDDPFTFDSPAPSQLVHSNTGSKYSPGFESFHKLANKKMFTAKLFKKSSSSNTVPSQGSFTLINQGEVSSAPGTPQSRNSGSGSDFSQHYDGERKFPAIKGTITHNWGDQSRSHHPVIKLNSRTTADGGTYPDLEPAVRISSQRRDSATSALTTSSYENTVPSRASTDDHSLHRHEGVRERHIYNELSKVKSKNRQARIHSHDDVVQFEKMSSVSLELLASTVSPQGALQEKKKISEKENEVDRLNVDNENPKSGVQDSGTSTLKQKSPSVSFEDTPTHERHRSSEAISEEDDASYLLTPDMDDDDDDTSKFSFELSGLNGRTSSVKYYSKPEPAEAVYIDDIYGEDNFDDELNCYEDDVDDMEFPSNNFDISDESSDTPSERVDKKPTESASKNTAKTLKNYNDLFDLSDEDEVGYDGSSLENLADQDLSEHDTSEEGIQSKMVAQESDFDKETTVQRINGMGKTTKANLSSKPVKSFSDIFNLDDSDEDQDDDWNDRFSIKDEHECHIDNGHSSGQVNQYKEFAKDDLESHVGCEEREGSEKKMVKLASPMTSKSNPVSLTNPVHILVTSPSESPSESVTISDPHLSFNNVTTTLPPPARSQTLKIHDLNSNLDSEVPGMMSNLYFINESEEDEYYERKKVSDDDYLDEINTVPEDFDFSDSELETSDLRTPLRRSTKGSFRSTHSYSSQPTGTAKENTPTRNKLEIKNKTVTFFDHSWDRSPVDRTIQRSPQPLETKQAPSKDDTDDYLISPVQNNGEIYNPVTPTNSFSKPAPEYLNDYSLSPIQENTSSVDNSPTLPY